MAQWLVRRALRQLRVRFPLGIRPSAQQKQLFAPTQEFHKEHPAGEQLENEYNVCTVLYCKKNYKHK